MPAGSPRSAAKDRDNRPDDEQVLACVRMPLSDDTGPGRQARQRRRDTLQFLGRTLKRGVEDVQQLLRWNRPKIVCHSQQHRFFDRVQGALERLELSMVFPHATSSRNPVAVTLGAAPTFGKYPIGYCRHGGRTYRGSMSRAVTVRWPASKRGAATMTHAAAPEVSVAALGMPAGTSRVQAWSPSPIAKR